MTNTPKTLDTLIKDIHGVFTSKDHDGVSEENLERLGNEVKEAVKTSIIEASKPREPMLRMSKIGTPNRKLWFEMNYQRDEQGSTEDVEGLEDIPLDPNLAIKFLYGHILEALVLFLVRESGHTVEGEQDTLEINGVEGHRDCKIDGVNVDVKSASQAGFRKFKQGALLHDDPFGYLAQLSGYIQADNGGRLDEGGAFLVINKESGELTLLEIDPMDLINATDRVNEIKEVVEQPTPPDKKCYEPQPLGESGNKVLHKNCTYCPFKEICWQNDANNGQGLRKFQYSGSIKYFTDVQRTPNVPEVTD